jgi:hypothetical protein
LLLEAVVESNTVSTEAKHDTIKCRRPSATARAKEKVESDIANAQEVVNDGC